MTPIVRNIPNVLTVLRLLLAPLTALLIVQSDFRAALFVFAFAGASDAADGYLAKRFGLESRFGAYPFPSAGVLVVPSNSGMERKRPSWAKRRPW